MSGEERPWGICCGAKVYLDDEDGMEAANTFAHWLLMVLAFLPGAATERGWAIMECTGCGVSYWRALWVWLRSSGGDS